MKVEIDLIEYIKERLDFAEQKELDDDHPIFTKTYYTGMADAFKEILDILGAV